MDKIKIEQHGFWGAVWIAAWLFTVGYLHLDFVHGLLAILIWPYYLGAYFAALPH